MKQIIVTLFAVIVSLCMGTLSYAKSEDPPAAETAGPYELSVSLAPATGPGDYDSGWGINVGAGYMLASIDKNLQARVDLSVYQFDHNFYWGSGTYTRVPITFSARYYIPLVDKLRAFGQAGLETSIDTHDTSSNQRQNQVNVGISPGAGIEFIVNPKVGLFALAIEHLITDNYFSLQLGVVTHF
jgi:Outer membrane protein beta-barrel domain